MRPRDAGLLVLCAVAAWALAPAQGAEWTPLFNGENLDGWTCRSKDKFLVEDRCLVGTQTDGQGDDLVTKRQWDNFELRFTYKVKWPANSGVWFRFARGRGYQFDILKYKSPVAYSGTLYCPGKMFITKNLDEKLENRDEWNDGGIYANGDHIILWLNGQKVGECHDKTLAKGAIGIQVHGGGGMKNMKIAFKKIEIRELKPGDEPTPPPPPAKAAP
jgi:hypothetical protein